MRDRHAVLSSTRQRCTGTGTSRVGAQSGSSIAAHRPGRHRSPRTRPPRMFGRPVMDQSTVRVSTVLVTARFGSGSVAGLRMTAPSVIEKALLWQGHSIVPLRTRFTVHPR